MTAAVSRSSRRVTVRGVDFHVELRNLITPSSNDDAPTAAGDVAIHPVLCLPGALGTARSDFGPLLDRGLKTNDDDGEDISFGIVALDPRGLGQSVIHTATATTFDDDEHRRPQRGEISRSYPLDFYRRDALDAHAVMTQLGFPQFSVLGWSDGAITAVHLASHPDTKSAVRKLVVWGGNAYVTGKDLEAWEAVRDVKQTWSQRMRSDKLACLNVELPELQRLNDELTDAYGAIYEKKGGDLCLRELHDVSCPTLVLHGAKDVICYEEHARYVSRQIANAKLVVFDEGKHNLHLRHADAFSEVVRDFLTGQEGEEEEVEPAIDEIAYAFMGSKALFTALRVGVFDAIDVICREKEAADAVGGNAMASFEDVEERCASGGVTGERLKTLLTACVGLRLIRRCHPILGGESQYRLPKASAEQLCRSSRQYWGDYIMGQVDAQFYERMTHLYDIMESGTAATHGYEAWFEKDPDAAKRYTEAQHNGSLATGYALWKRFFADYYDDSRDNNELLLLDVGGGSGAFSIAAARTIPNCSAVILDLPNVITVARDIIAKEKDPTVQKRLSTLALSATSPSQWQGLVKDNSFDLVLLSYVSGSIPVQNLAGLYANAFRALRPGGRLIIHDFFVDNAGDGPKSAALWALAHVTVNPEGMGLRPNRVVGMLGREGFVAPRVDDLILGATQIIVATKPLTTGVL